jgi:uncharacterized protein (TIGR00290 family)
LLKNNGIKYSLQTITDLIIYKKDSALNKKNCQIKNATTIASWSGGKDSCLACFKAMDKGYQIGFLLNLISRKFQRCCFHGIPKKLIQLQANLMGIPLFQKEVSDDMALYEQEFKEAVTSLKSKGSREMVFGDIYLMEHKNWVERVGQDLNIEVIEPLWGTNTLKVMEEFIDLGFKAVVVSAQASLFSKDIIGQPVDREILAILKRKGICPCGENGEYHTFVLGGPIFKKGEIRIKKSQVVFKEGFWSHWFLDIQDYVQIPK